VPSTEWHAGTSEDAAAHLSVNPAQGLDHGEVEKRRLEFGPNRLVEETPRSVWFRFLDQFNNLLIIVLIGAAALAASIGNLKDATVIFAVVILNALFGLYQEYRAEQSLTALKKMLAQSAKVRRGGEIGVIAAEGLVPGDVVLLEAGDRAPADGRLVAAQRMDVDESTLTGESQPTLKQAEAVADKAAPLAERPNMIYMNTVVTRGRGELIVTATGMNTEMGRLSQELATAADPQTPLQIQLDRLAKRLAIVAAGLVGVLFVLELLRGQSLTHVIMESIALAVAAMPEGLPAVVTVTLALGMRRMARHRAIVKRLASVETLGCTTVICTDKTGTLTVNQMTAREIVYQGAHFSVTGEGYLAEGEIRTVSGAGKLPDFAPLFLPIVLCNDSKIKEGQVIGDPMEGALLVLAAKGGVDRELVNRDFPRIAEIPFDARQKYMATYHRAGDGVRLFVKGAPDVVASYCANLSREAGESTAQDTMDAWVANETARLASQGLRVLAIAARTLPDTRFEAASDLEKHVHDLTLIGLVGLLDPPRTEAKEAIAQCRKAGVRVKMITGDHAQTAIAIARDLGLSGSALTGADLEQLSTNDLLDAVDGATVFARVVPEQKVRIVRALQERGHVVAMTGDGVNDAPALKTADIGIAMGNSGTEVAKEAADMVLTDDNFATIVGAIKEGRSLYSNIVKFVRFQLSTTVGAILTVFWAPFLGLPDPFNPIQILWVAMIMDGPPAVALGLDPARPEVMEEPPRDPKEMLLTLRRVVQVLTFGTIMTIGTLGVLYFDLQVSSKEHALTLAFTTFVLFQVFNVFNARSENMSAFNGAMFGNRMLWVSLIGILSLQATAIYWVPATEVFQTTALSALDWSVAFAVASSVLVLEEMRKAIGRIGLRLLGA